MKTGALAGLVTVAAIFASAAVAQETPSSPQISAPALPPTPFTTNATSEHHPGWNSWQERNYEVPAGRNINVGFRALDNKNFSRAEEIFVDVVQRNPRNAAANFYLGTTRMSLGKWQDAKGNLELAARGMSRHPDPKSRLGVTYAMLGDWSAANAQRAELVKMSMTCKNSCKLSPYISAGIKMIDDALARSPASKAQG